METVNNIAAAASKAIWGESEPNSIGSTESKAGIETKENKANGIEPLSGELGNVEKGEPYDKGNIDLETAPLTEPTKPEVGTVKDIPYRSAEKSEEVGIPTFAAESAASKTATAQDPDLTKSVPPANPAIVGDAIQKPSFGTAPISNPTPFVENLQGERGVTTGTNTTRIRESDSHVKTNQYQLPSTIEPASADIGAESIDKGKRDAQHPISSSTGNFVGTAHESIDHAKDHSMRTEGTHRQAGEMIKAIERKEGMGEGKDTPRDAGVTESKHDTSDAGIDEKDGKEKLSFKEKIKAKLHKN